MSNITSNQIANRTRYHQLDIEADGTGGAVASRIIGAPEVSFTGTPTGYGRSSGIIPFDYAGGTIAICVYLSGASANNQALNYYVAGHGNGDNITTTWNIQSNQTTGSTINLSANVLKKFTLYTIGAGVVQAGDYVGTAIRPNAAITGTIVYSACWLEYTADS